MHIIKLLTLGASLSLTGSISAVLPHLDDFNKQVEHLALLAIVPESQASNVAVTSGNWSNPTTWGGSIPANFGTVVIPQGVTVTVDAVIAARLRWIRVNGTLQFATAVNTLLTVDTIVIDPVGSFVMGTPEQPINANVTAKIVYADFGDVDRNWDPRGLSRGLICHGKARIFGAPTTPFAMLAQPARVGHTTLTLDTVPTNWKVGGRLVLPSVGFIYEGGDGLFRDDDEELTITAINGATVSLNRPLKYHHLSPTGTAAIPIPVAYLDRNAILTSENFATARRGHNMFMHNWDVKLSDVLIEQCGRTSAATQVTDPLLDGNGRLIPATTGNDRGRYALHFHRTIPDPNKPAHVKRVVIVNSPKLGVVNHDSNLICEDSVAYDVAGSAFFTEVGSEIGAFRRNLAIRTIRGGGPRGEVERFASDGTGEGVLLPGGPDFGSNGNAFWFQGAGVEVTDNMAFKTKDMAYVYDTVGLVASGEETRFLRSNLTTDNPYYDPNNTGATLAVTQVPIRKFSGNIAAGAFTGIMLRKNNPVGKPSVMENSKAVNLSNYGIDAEYGGPKTFRNLVIRGGTLRSDGSPSGWLNGLGEMGFVSNQVSNNYIIEWSEISNFMRGARFTVAGNNRISDSIFDNISNIRVENGPSTNAPTFIERTILRHSMPPLANFNDLDLNTHRDVMTYKPFDPIFPITANGVSLPWPDTIGATNFYTVASGTPQPGFAPISGPTTPLVESGPIVPPAAAAPVLIAALSRKAHGSAGNFDVALPLTGTPGIECRRNNGSLTLVLTFDQNVVSGGSAVTSGSGVVTGSSFAGNQMTITVASSGDRQTLSVSINNIVGATGGTLATSTLPIALLFTDADATGAVNVADVARTRVRAATGIVDAGSFRSDFNADGAINVLDIALNKINSGASVQ